MRRMLGQMEEGLEHMRGYSSGNKVGGDEGGVGPNGGGVWRDWGCSSRLGVLGG